MNTTPVYAAMISKLSVIHAHLVKSNMMVHRHRMTDRIGVGHDQSRWRQPVDTLSKTPDASTVACGCVLKYRVCRLTPEALTKVAGVCGIAPALLGVSEKQIISELNFTHPLFRSMLMRRRIMCW